MTFADLALSLGHRIKDALGFSEWTIYFERTDGASPDPCRASASVDHEYQEATITLDPDRMRSGDDMREFMVHEFAHLDTDPLYSVAEECIETLRRVTPPQQHHWVDGMAKRVEREAERTTTLVGKRYLRLLEAAGALPAAPTKG